MINIKDKLALDMKVAMKSGDKNTLRALRNIIGTVKQIEIDKRIELSDSEILSIIQKITKKLKDSIKQFKDAGRIDLVNKEQQELDIINTYLPAPVSELEINKIVTKVINELSAKSIADMGLVVKTVKSKLDGIADMAIVSKIIKNKLS